MAELKRISEPGPISGFPCGSPLRIVAADGERGERAILRLTTVSAEHDVGQVVAFLSWTASACRPLDSLSH